MTVNQPYYGNHFTFDIYICQIITLYTLNLHNVICQLYLYKARKKGMHKQRRFMRKVCHDKLDPRKRVSPHIVATFLQGTYCIILQLPYVFDLLVKLNDFHVYQLILFIKVYYSSFSLVGSLLSLCNFNIKQLCNELDIF